MRTLSYVLLLTGLFACRKAADTPVIESQTSGTTIDSAQFPSVDDSSLTIAGLHVGQHESQVRALLGQPVTESKPESSEVLAEPSRTLSYADLSVGLVGHRVDAIMCLGTSCATADGVRIGDDRSKIEHLYGRGRYTSDGLLTYLARRSDCAIAFSLYRDTVGTFKVWCQES